MPVGLLHVGARAAAADAGAAAPDRLLDAAGTVAALLVGRRRLVLVLLEHLEVQVFLIAGIDRHEGLPAIADHNPIAVPDSGLVHRHTHSGPRG